MDTLSDERVEEIIAGCEGVTPGPWTYEVQPFGSAIAKDSRCIATAHYNLAIIGTLLPHAENASHIARLDPQTAASLATELLALRKRVGELEGALKPFHTNEVIEGADFGGDEEDSVPPATPKEPS